VLLDPVGGLVAKPVVAEPVVEEPGDVELVPVLGFELGLVELLLGLELDEPEPIATLSLIWPVTLSKHLP
jgi:hypothetical protein